MQTNITVNQSLIDFNIYRMCRLDKVKTTVYTTCEKCNQHSIK